MNDLRLDCLRMAVEHAETYDEAIDEAARIFEFMHPKAAADLPVIEAKLNVASINAKIAAAKLPFKPLDPKIAGPLQQMADAADVGSAKNRLIATVNEAQFGSGEKRDRFSNLQGA